MPTYVVTDPVTGRKIRLTGDKPPTKEELDLIFSKVKSDVDPTPKVVPQEPSLGEQVVGAAENLASMGTSALAEPLAGLSGIVAEAIPGGKTGAEQVQVTREAMTYNPQTEAGILQQQYLGEALQPVGEAIQSVERGVGDTVYDVASSPYLSALSAVTPAAGFMKDLGAPATAAIASSVPAGLVEILGLKGAGLSRGKRGIKGIPDDVNDMLKTQGLDLESLPEDVISQIQTGVDPRNAIQQQRAQLFESLDIPTLRSRITQEQGDFLTERKLKRQVGVDEAEKITQRQLDESAAFQNATNKLIDDLGVPEESGDLIKNALSSRKALQKAEVKSLYDDLANISQGKGVPIIGTEIMDSLDSDNIRSMAGKLSNSERRGVNDVLIEFGIDDDPERVSAFLSRQDDGALPTPDKIRPLNVLNQEDFNQALNALSGPDSSPQMRGVIGAIKNGLEKELDIISESVSSKNTPVAMQSKEVIDAAKRARNKAREVFAEFSPKSFVGKMTMPIRGDFDRDMILSSEVVKKMLGKSRDGSIESISEVVDSLVKSGDKGKNAIKSLQSSVISEALNHALKGRQFSPAMFSKRLDQIGRDKVSKIFESDKEALSRLNRIEEAGRLTIEPDAVARSSGTADDLVNWMERSSFFRPFIVAGGGATGLIAAEGVSSAGQQLRKAAVKRKIKRQLDTNAALKRKYGQAMNQYPYLMMAAGLGDLMTVEEDGTNN